MKWKFAIAAAAMSLVSLPSIAVADSVDSIEGARAKERRDGYVNRQDREQLRRWGGNDDYGRYYTHGPYEYGGYYGDDDYGPAYRYRTYPY